jgi:hypothetical protein
MLGNLHVRFGVGAGVKLPGLHHHVLAQSKGSLSDAASLCYRTVKGDDGIVTVEWLGASKYSATDLAAANATADEHSALLEARYVLYSILSEGRVPASDVIRLAKHTGVSERTLKRAKRDLGVASWKHGSGPGSQWSWELPPDEELLRPFKSKDLDCLMDELIYGDDGEPQEGTEPTHRPGQREQRQQEDEGDEGSPVG